MVKTIVLVAVVVVALAVGLYVFRDVSTADADAGGDRVAHQACDEHRTCSGAGASGCDDASISTCSHGGEHHSDADCTCGGDRDACTDEMKKSCDHAETCSDEAKKSCDHTETCSDGAEKSCDHAKTCEEGAEKSCDHAKKCSEDRESS